MQVDREYLIRIIDHIERERSEHDRKFAGNPKHANCLPRFDTTIAKLKEELQKVEQS